MWGLQAEQTVEAAAEKRLAGMGSDRSRWPAPAREEVLRLEKKQHVSHQLATTSPVVTGP